MPEQPDDPKNESDKPEDKKGQASKQPSPLSKWSLGWALLILFVVVMAIMMNSGSKDADNVTFSQFLAATEAGQLVDDLIKVQDNRFTAELKEGVKHPNPDRETTGGNISIDVPEALVDDWQHKLQLVGADFAPKVTRVSFFLQLLGQFLVFALIILLIWFLFFRAMRGAGGGPGGMLGSFGRSKHKVLTKEHSTITLDDVAGIQEAKDEVSEIIEFLRNPKKFQRLGGRVPRRRHADWTARLRQDPPRQGRRRRSRCPLLLDLRQRLRRDVCRRRCLARP